MFKSNPRVFGVSKTHTGKSKFTTISVVAPSVSSPTHDSRGAVEGTGAVAGRSSQAIIGSDELMENTVEVPLNSKAQGRAVETSAVETANTMAGPGNPIQGGTTTDITTTAMYNAVLAEYFPDDNYTNPGSNKALNDVYRDIYYNDAICGSVVDLMSTLPFSEFSLSGVKDDKKLDLFTNSVERMRISTLLPQLSIEFQSFGAWLGSLGWSETDKIFNSITPQDLDYAEITPVPVFGMDPIISMRISPQVAQFMASEDKRAKDLHFLLPDDFRTDEARKFAQATATAKRGASSGRDRDQNLIALTAENTIFIPRQGMAKDYKGVSLFRRVLVPWLIEKALMRGTMDQVYKRQRAISHIVAGDEEWKPSNEEMQAIANLFLNADLDPVGSFVVTRNGISVSDVRAGGDFWRWDQTHADLATIKLRALGVSESFVTGESNFATMEATLSVMMEQIRNYRHNITREMFYEKTFPLIAKRNEITVKKYSSAVELSSAQDDYGRDLINNQGRTKMYRDRDTGMLTVEIAGGRSNMPGLQDIEQYVVPEVNWHKRLMPEADAAYLDLLNMMDEKGLPIPVRLLAAAGGIKVEKLLEGMDDDIKLRQKLGEYGKQIRDINKESGLTPPEEGMEGGGSELASMFPGSLRRIGIGNRKQTREDASTEVANLDSRGRRRVQTGGMKRNAVEKLNKEAANAMVELARRENAKPDKHKRERTYSYKKRDKWRRDDL